MPVEYTGAALGARSERPQARERRQRRDRHRAALRRGRPDDSRDHFRVRHGAPGARLCQCAEPARRFATECAASSKAAGSARGVSATRARSSCPPRAEFRSSRAASRASAAETSRSSSARSAAESVSSSAAWLSRTCASLEAFGITTTSGWRSSHASAMRAGVAPSRAAIFFEDGIRAQPPRIAAERRVGHHGHAALAAPRQQLPLDAALLQVVQHLIRRDARRRRRAMPLPRGRRDRNC